MDFVQANWRRLAVGYCAVMALFLLGSDAAQVDVSPPQPEAVSAAPVQTSGGYAYGYGTYYVSTKRTIPANWGNARNWYLLAQTDGFAVGAAPSRGAVAWTAQGLLGHVAYVEDVLGEYVLVSEMYYKGNWNRVTFRTVPASSFLYIY